MTGSGARISPISSEGLRLEDSACGDEGIGGGIRDGGAWREVVGRGGGESGNMANEDDTRGGGDVVEYLGAGLSRASDADAGWSTLSRESCCNEGEVD